MIVDAGVDHVGVDVGYRPRTVAGLRRAGIGVYLVDAPRQRLGEGPHDAVGLDVVDPSVGAYFRHALVWDHGREALDGVAIDEAHPQVMALR